MRKTTTAIYCAALFGLLLFAAGSGAANNAFKLENDGTTPIYGACEGIGGGHQVTRYGRRDFECQGRFHVRNWNDDETALETLASYPFDCAGGQTKVVTVTDVDPYSASTRCE